VPSSITLVHRRSAVLRGPILVLRALLVLVALSRVAHAQDEFEIQVYDSETEKLGAPGLEVHVNVHQYTDARDELHLTFEPHYGLRTWLELGGYFQTSYTSAPEASYAGAKLRAKLRWPRKLWCGRLGLAVNFELSNVPAQFEPNVWGSEARPIIDVRAGRLYGAFNPIVDTDLAGKLAGRPQFQPAAKLGINVTRALMLGVEGYSALGPFTSLGSEDMRRGFVVADITRSWWDLNLGVGVSYGINDHPIAKLIFGMHPP
jgi:hypothetical protein